MSGTLVDATAASLKGLLKMAKDAANADTDVAIVGAGPYGLSISAHLSAQGVNHRIVGIPMHSWLTEMPKGMLLKSFGFASTLYDPAGILTLQRYCNEHEIAYDDIAIPVPLELFCAYGLAFQKRLVPELEAKTLVALEHGPAGYVLRFDDGGSFTACRVVVAAGISHFRHIPAALSQFPAEFVSHSSEHNDPARFKGRDVTIIGAGASAIDLAVLLHEAGAAVRLIARRPSIGIESRMQLPRPLHEQIRHPMTGIGPGWRHRFYTDAPLLFHYLPEWLRLRQVKRVLGPSAGWPMKARFAQVPRLVGCQLKAVEVSGGRMHLTFRDGDGTDRLIATDHVIAATGYRSDLRRLPFLSEEIGSRLRSVEHTPILSSHFESSMAGLYFVGLISANSFGPVMRFAVGARFAAPWISRHLARTRRVRSRRGGGSPTWERVR